MIIEIVFYLSLVLVLLGSLDVLLGEKEKKQLENACIRAWDWLDTQEVRITTLAKRLSFSYSQYRKTIWLIYLSLFCFIALVFSGSRTIIIQVIYDLAFLLWLTSGVILVFVTLKNAFGRSGLLFALALFAISLVLGIGFAVVFSLVSHGGWRDGSLMFVVLLGPFTGVVFYFLMFASLWVAKGAVWLLELLMRRITEYPRGVILAVSTLIAAVAGGFKLFLSSD
jgi:hypothetical protein